MSASCLVFPLFQQISKECGVVCVCVWLAAGQIGPMNTFAYMYTAGKFEPGWVQKTNLLARLDLWGSLALIRIEP